MKARPWIGAVLLFFGFGFGFGPGFGSGSAFADAPPVRPPVVAKPPAPLVPLDRAAAARLVEVRGVHPDSYTSVELRITSKVKEPLTVDLAGGYLTPRSGRCQRLGLSYPEGQPPPTTPDLPPGAWPLTLAPGETKSLRVHCCCMDAGKPCPTEGEVFTLATVTTPPDVEKALRWWVAHPTAPQGFVNEAIWQGRPALLDRPWAPEAERTRGGPPDAPRGRDVLSLGGMAFLLNEGELVRVDSEGARFFVATGIYGAVPLSDGLLAVGRGAERREVWRFAMTGEPAWTPKFEIEPTRIEGEATWPDAVPAARGATLLVGPQSVVLRTPEGSWKDLISEPDADGLEVAPVDASRTRFVAVARRGGTTSTPQFRLYDVDATAGRASLRRTFWKARDVAAGPGGLFEISPAGHLERYDAGSYVRVEAKRTFDRILAVGLDRVVVAAEEGRIWSVEIRSGAATALPIPAPVGAAQGARRSGLVVDPLTDDVLWDAGTVFRRLKVGADEPETLR